MSLELNALKVFHHAVRLGSYTAASRQLHVSPSAVSHAIRKLEDRLGRDLVSWRARRMELSEDGAYLRDVCERVFAELDAAERWLARSDDRVEHRVVLGAPVEFGTTVLLRRMGPLLRSHPELHLDFRLSNELVQPILRDEIDLAVDCTVHGHPSVEGQRLFREDYAVIASPDFVWEHGLDSPEALRRVPALSLDREGVWWRRLVALLPASRRPHLGRIVQVDHVRGIIHATQDGLGVGLVPRYTVLQELDEGSLVRLFPDLELQEDDFCLYVKAARADQPGLRLVSDYLLGLQLAELEASAPESPGAE